MPRRLAVILAAALAAGAVLVPQAALAAAPPAAPRTVEGPLTWAVVPASETGPDGRGRIDIIAEPGDLYPENVAIRNLGEQPITLELLGLDAAQGADGGFALLDAEESGEQGIRAWTRLAAAEVTVPPRSHLVVPVVFDIPADAEPGDHAGAIVAVATVEGAGTGTVRYQTGTRVSVRVAGPVDPALAVDGLDARYQGVPNPFGAGALAVDAALRNAGTVRLAPTATVRVTAPFGLWGSEASAVELGELLPGASVAGAFLLEGVPPLGPMEVVVEFPAVASHGQEVTAATRVESVAVTVWAVPWSALALIGVVLAAAAIVALARRSAIGASATTGC